MFYYTEKISPLTPCTYTCTCGSKFHHVHNKPLFMVSEWEGEGKEEGERREERKLFTLLSVVFVGCGQC